MKDKYKKIFNIIFLISIISSFFIGSILLYFSNYDNYNLSQYGRNLYEIIYGPIYNSSYYMQRIPSYIMGLFFIIYALISITTIMLFKKKNNLTRGAAMTSCTIGLVALLLSRPIRFEIYYILLIIWLFQLSITIILWKKLLFLVE
jgi:hypothetical protein